MTWVNFKELREKLDFREVLRHYGVEINTSRREQHHGKCPLPTHQGQRRGTSFSAQLERGIWKCFGCGAQGNVLDFACRMEKLDPDKPDDIRKIALMLADRYRITSEKPPAPSAKKPAAAAAMPTVVNAPLDFALKDLDPDHPYLLGRGFTKETIEKFELGFCSRGLMKDRVAIPLRDTQGKLIGYAGRVVDDNAITEENPKYRFPASREREGKRYEFSKGLFLYNGNNIVVPAEELVIVEGFPAVWWLVQNEIENVVGLMSATCSAEQIGLIVGMVPRRGRIWIMTDGDQAGQYCAETLLKKLASYRMVRWLELKDGRKPQHCTGDELREMLF
jgi:DNA primase